MKIMKTMNTVLVLMGLVTFTVLVSVLQPETSYYGREYDVRVINGFKNNSSMPLVIWCWSESEDLGGLALQEGDDFGWRVRTTLWATNHFMCTMKWDLRRRRFDAFVAGRDTSRCAPLRKCSWLVKDDGFYFSNDEVNWNKDFSWIY